MISLECFSSHATHLYRDAPNPCGCMEGPRTDDNHIFTGYNAPSIIYGKGTSPQIEDDLEIVPPDPEGLGLELEGPTSKTSGGEEESEARSAQREKTKWRLRPSPEPELRFPLRKMRKAAGGCGRLERTSPMMEA
ncbi:hypothetical protein NDU88_007322 [Pleurodeles waltl]|uniref:Uncharacterized protein n=1 Tax=Pleurodeles waltl TaxID=8319 RepID=A0AAV7NSR8_PLEWA|nr:hypothetical protein NDU88_007322 [Pleurodeles waltl]